MRKIILTGLILLTGCDGAKTYSGGMPEKLTPVVKSTAPDEIVQTPEVVVAPPNQTDSGMVSASVPISLHPVYPYPAPDDCDPSVQIPLPNGGFGACVPDSLHPVYPYPAPDTSTDDCDPSVQIPLPNGGFGACVPDSLHPIHPPVTIPTGG